MRMKWLGVLLLVLLSGSTLFAGDFPEKPKVPRLVNDYAGMMSAAEISQLEAKLLLYEQESSTQITVVTIKSLGGYDIAQYATELGERWGVGQKGKDNGVVVLASKNDRKVNISVGYGLEGALTDATSGLIIRQEIVPEFKKGNFYKGFDKAAGVRIKATKGEYKADPRKTGEQKKIPAIVIVILIVIVYVILWIISKRGGGGGGGGYVSRRGYSDMATGMLLGSLFGGRGGGSSGGFGGGSSGGFGGFGGGSFGGGGASGSW